MRALVAMRAPVAMREQAQRNDVGCSPGDGGKGAEAPFILLSVVQECRNFALMTTNACLNLFDYPDSSSGGETFADLLSVPGLRIERIVSYGQASPPDFWYDQNWDEWVIVLDGEAHLELEGKEEPLVLRRGDHAWLPAGCRHRVAYTSADPPALWLAVHR